MNKRKGQFNRLASGLLVLALIVAAVPLGPFSSRNVYAQATAVFINEIHYDNTGTDAGEAIEIAGPAGTDLTGWSVVLYNGNGGAVYDTDSLSGTIPDQCGGYGTVVLTYPTNGLQNGSPDGMALVDSGGAVVQFLSYEGTFVAVGGPADGMTSTDIGVAEPFDTPVGDSLQLSGAGAIYEDFTWGGPAANTFGACNTGQTFEQPPPMINEIHYDNTGTDTGEAIEIAGPAGTDLTGWSVVLYNGSTGAVYDTDPLSGTIPDHCNGYGTVVLTYPTNGLQNGSPDGMALVDSGGAVVQLLSYEGTFVAVGGPADGMTSTDIGVAEPFDTPVGDSLQLGGTGIAYEDFTWEGPLAETFGACNAHQTFGSEPPPPVINEFSASTTGTDVEYVEIFGSPDTDYSSYAVLEIEGDSTGAGFVDEVIPVGTTDSAGFWLGNLPANALENGTISLLLVQNFSGALGDDLDTDNDGSLDTTPWDAVVDAVAVYDGGTSDFTYGVPALGPNYDGVSNFPPGGASRLPDGFDTDAATDWVRNDFDLFGIPGYPGSPALGEAVNTPGAPNAAITVPTDPLGVCGDPATLIHDIQGSGLASGDVGSIREVEAVVVATFQGPDQIGGYFVQEEDADADADPLTSEGLRIFDTTSTPNVGDVVRIRGSVAEFFGLTELNNIIGFAVCGSGVATAATVTLPVDSVDDFERYEGMAVTFPQTLYISEFFNFDRFGEIVLTTERQFQPTATYEPGSPEAAQLALDNSLGRITLDDGRGSSNPDPALHPNGGIFDLTNRFRGGDTVQNVTGVLDYNFGAYKIQPTQGADYTSVNLRTAFPDPVGGSLKVASFNVLNYFTTLDDGVNDICGPLGNQECRGADTPEEFTRQHDKIIAALVAMDADVVGLIEIENHPGDIPTAYLVSGLNAVMGEGTYDYIATGAIGSDAIRQALIYKQTTVSPVGDYAVLDSSVDSRFLDDYNRPVLAQTFQDNTTGGIFTVAVNHLKSKGSDCNAVGDPDTGDGSGNCNLTRKAAAEALVDWLATDPTGSGDTDFFIIGDLNSYDKEDPIDALVAGGYTDLLYQYIGEDAYSYVFDGQLGYLDHALASPGLLDEVTGATVWHINADEPDILDYDMTFKQDAQDELYEPNAYRASDHDPVIVGLNLSPSCIAAYPSIDTLWPVNHKFVSVDVLGVVHPDLDSVAITIDRIFQDEPVNGTDDGDTSPDGQGIGTATAEVRAERDGLGNGRVYHIYFTAYDDDGDFCTGEVNVDVPLSRGEDGAAIDDGPLYDSTVTTP